MVRLQDFSYKADSVNNWFYIPQAEGWRFVSGENDQFQKIL